MASFNKVILLGNLTRDPELRYTPNGTPVATFGMATNRRSGQGDERREDVCFVDIVVFGREAETASEFLSKGRAALIEGRLQWRSWEGQDGQKRSKHEVVAERIQFMPRGREEGMERTSAGDRHGAYAAGNRHGAYESESWHGTHAASTPTRRRGDGFRSPSRGRRYSFLTVIGLLERAWSAEGEWDDGDDFEEESGSAQTPALSAQEDLSILRG